MPTCEGVATTRLATYVDAYIVFWITISGLQGWILAAFQADVVILCPNVSASPCGDV